jgi:two-component system response regulator NreC
MSVTRVLIADDHAILCAGLRLLLNSQADMTVVADVVDWPSAIAEAGRLRPDVITVDLSMPGGDPFEGVREITRACETALIVVLTMHAHVDYFRAAVAAGAHGYVLKTSADEELLSAIRIVRSGQFFVSQSLKAGTESTSQRRSPAAAEKSGLALLSDRERMVLRLAAQGLTNREVADQVRLSVKTIESYRARMMAKLGLSTRSELVAYAARHGMLPSSAAPIVES